MAHRNPHQTRHEVTIIRIGADVLALLAVLLILSMFSWDWLTAPSTKVQNVTQVASAFFTATAVIVSLWLASRTDRRLDKEAREKAEMMAAKMEPELRFPLVYYQGVMASLIFGTFADQRQKLAHVFQLLAQPVTIPQTESIACLIPLPNGCAGRIARSFSLFSHLRDLSLATHSAVLTNTMPDYNVSRQLEDIQALLSESIELLRAAHKECEDAAKIGAPRLSNEELGNDSDDSNSL